MPMPFHSEFDHIGVIDPAGVAKRRGADGYGVVWGIVGTGIDGTHPHFARYENLELTPPLRHRDFTVMLTSDQDAPLGATSMDDADLAEEALFDGQGHGTHVAGLIAGFSNVADSTIDWHIEESLVGIAPRCKLVSLKVIDDDGRGDELGVLHSLQYVGSLNEAAGHLLIHGLLIPLSLHWDHANFACGASPVCEAVDALIDSGVVVVVPAGNDGLKGPSTILDPGNAERAITVGSTHRFLPYRYGASYFSARGPTADGRIKPDLLAPGEKILSAVPAQVRGRQKVKRKRKLVERARPAATYEMYDGTSMAAAHVAGALAAILSVRPDLIGHPEHVKDLLLQSATDLERDRYFQGRGLLNLSRALDEHAQIKPEQRHFRKVAEIKAPASPVAIQPDGLEVSATNGRNGKTKRFAIAFSFAGEQNEYVGRVWKALRRDGGLPRRSIFYHKQFEGELSRPNLDVYLQDIYANQTELLVVFLSAEYATKEWTGLEWRVVRDIIKKKEARAVMPIRFDDTHINGLFSIDGYVSAAGREPEDIADLILDRLESNRAQEATA